MDEALRDAIERRDAIRQSIVALQRQLEGWEAFIQAYTAQEAEPRHPRVEQADLFTSRLSKRAERAARVKAMMDEAERAILTAGRPMTRTQLLDHLEANGFRIEGGDKSKVLGTNLWRSGRFVNIEKVGYWPLSAAIPTQFAGLPIRNGVTS